FALPVPKPTWPASSPTTTSAANERFLPPLTTLVTRLIEINWSLSINPPGEIRCLLFIITFFLRGSFGLVETGLARRIDQSFHASMIKIAATIEHDVVDTGLAGALGYRFADVFRRLDVAAALSREVFLGSGSGS